MKSSLTAQDETAGVLAELKRREPIFHHPEFGTTRADFEGMIDTEFWEIGASGKAYSREQVLDVLAQRSASAKPDSWETRDFHCQTLAHDLYLLTYTLSQGPRVTRRSTIWKRAARRWIIVFHQGTLIQER